MDKNQRISHSTFRLTQDPTPQVMTEPCFGSAYKAGGHVTPSHVTAVLDFLPVRVGIVVFKQFGRKRVGRLKEEVPTKL